METHRNTLTRNEDIKCNVDWLTEVMRRYTEARLAVRDFGTVSMKNPLRLEKVCLFQLLVKCG